ncbi:MAG TPA: plastocyanin/azurin family copper-binding protein, partial [Gemmatimonadales bacterium]
LAACNSSDGDIGPGGPPLEVVKAPSKSGDAQEGLVNEALTSPIRVYVTRDGVPEENVEVEWLAGDQGAINPPSSSTDVDGIAESNWTLGPATGEQNASATVDDADGSPVRFVAEAVEPGTPLGATVQVLSEGGNRFEPANVTITVGQSVTWVWPEGSVGHNVVPDEDTPASSGGLTNGPVSYAFTFPAVGVYRYHCGAHGGKNGIGMSGIVTVVAEQP